MSTWSDACLWQRSSIWWKSYGIRDDVLVAADAETLERPKVSEVKVIIFADSPVDGLSLSRTGISICYSHVGQEIY